MKGTMNSPYDRAGLGWGGGVVNHRLVSCCNGRVG